MTALGVQPGDHVALLAGNRVEFVERLLGATRAGMLVTPVKMSWTAAEIAASSVRVTRYHHAKKPTTPSS